MDKDRLEKLFLNAVDYLAELKKREDTDEWNYFWQNIIGMTKEEQLEYGLTIIDTDKLEKLFISIAEQYEEHDDIKDRIRGLHSFGELTDKEYDYIIENWDNMLQKHNL